MHVRRTDGIRGGDPGQVTRIAEEFIRLHEAGQVTDLDEYCARYPEDQRADVRNECEQLLRIHGVIKQPDRLSAGQTLGSYKIIESIGKGGMGEVYRARDSELDRDIAIKVLPPELACQPERVKRFKREAKAVAALDHPNIVTIHSVEEADGLHFITMQLVQGKTLSELIPRKGMALGDYFDLAIPLADAISTAHESGITHRDLKPANIMVTKEGRVEILDFGLAKLTEQTSPEQTTKLRLSVLTDEGQIVGTVAYMSPEQAEGREVDHRTDIFSLGIILYEMITGERPFKGESRVALMSSIMKDTPSAVTELKAGLPRHLGRIVKRCLAKDVKQRYQTATDVCNELEELRKEIASGVSVAPLQQVGGRRWLWPAVSGALLVTLLLFLLVPRPSPAVQDAGAEDGGPSVLAAIPLTDLSGHQTWPSISPDGESFVFTDATDGDIYWQPIGAAWNPRPLTEESPDTEGIQAAYHAKEDKIAFRRDDKSTAIRPASEDPGGIWVMDANGALSREIVNDRGVSNQLMMGRFHPAWSPDGNKLVYTTADDTNPYSINWGGRLWIVDVVSGEGEDLTTSGSPFSPSWSPHNRWIAFATRNGGPPYKRGLQDIRIIRPSGGDPKLVTNDLHADSYPFWSPDGRFLYFVSDREGRSSLWAVRIDEESGEHGFPYPVWEPQTGRILSASISGTGLRIVCSVMMETYEIRSFDFDRESGQLADPLSEGTRLYYTNQRHLQGLTLSPDDAWLGFVTASGQENVLAIRADDSSRGRPDEVTKDPYKARYLAWYPEKTPDGYWLTFVSDRDGPYSQIYRARPDRPGITLLTNPDYNHSGAVWRPDGSVLEGNVLQPGPELGYAFPDGFPGEASGPQPYVNFSPGAYSWEGATWSRDERLIAGNWIGPDSYVRVREYRTGIVLHDAHDSNGTRYKVQQQNGNRWLDDTRLILWEMDLEKALLWNTADETATPIDGLIGPGEFVFSEDGKTLFALQRVTSNTDIWLLELDPESLEPREITRHPVDPVIAMPRVFLGATVKVNRQQRLDELSATDPQRGVLVVDVPEDSLAEDAGLQPDDVILRVGGIETNNPSDLQPAYLQTSRSDECEFIIFRDEEEQTLQVDGVLAVRLTAEDAKRVGNGQAPYYDPFRNAQRAWDDKTVSLAWDVAWQGAVTFEVFAEISGDASAAGATWTFIIADQALDDGTTPNTGDWLVFERVPLGQVTIESNGNVRAQLEPLTKPGQAVMNLRAIELIAR